MAIELEAIELNPPKDGSAKINAQIAPESRAYFQAQGAATAVETSRMVDQRTLPWLEFFQQDANSQADKKIIDRFPELRNPEKFAAALRAVVPLADLDKDGMTYPELQAFSQKNALSDAKGGAAAIAINHWGSIATQSYDRPFLGRERLTEADIKSGFDTNIDYQKMIEKHPELRDLKVYTDTMNGLWDRLSHGRDSANSYELSMFLKNGNGTERERAAVAIALLNYRTLQGLDGDWRGFFSKTDLKILEVMQKENLRQKLDEAVSKAEKDQTSPAASGAAWAIFGYAVASALGSEKPGKTAVLTGVSGAAAQASRNREARRMADHILEKKKELATTGIFDLPK